MGQQTHDEQQLQTCVYPITDSPARGTMNRMEGGMSFVAVVEYYYTTLHCIVW